MRSRLHRTETPGQGHGKDAATLFRWDFGLPQFLGGATWHVFPGLEVSRLSYLFWLSGAFLALVLVNNAFKYVINMQKGKLGERLLLSRKLTGNFPDFDRVLPKTQTHQVFLGKDELKSTVQRVSQFSEERSKAIRLQFADGEMKVFSSMSDTGESEETIAIDYTGPATDIGFNAQYLLDFLRAVGQDQVALHFKDPNSAGELRPGGDSNGYTYRYVVMPMRI